MPDGDYRSSGGLGGRDLVPVRECLRRTFWYRRLIIHETQRILLKHNLKFESKTLAPDTKCFVVLIDRGQSPDPNF